MCFGETHSWVTLFFGLVFVSITAYKYADKSLDARVLIIIFSLVVIMQLWEALAWRGFCYLASWGAYLTIIAQSLPLLLLVPSAIKTLEGKLGLGLLLLYYATVFIGANSPKCILDGNQIRYTWFDKWWQKIGYLIALGVVPLLLMKSSDIAWFWIFLFFLSLVFTVLVYGEFKSNGSIWCYFGAASSVFLLLFMGYKYGW